MDTADSLLSRIAIIHLVAEARGVDMNPLTLAKLQAAGDAESSRVLEIIHADEITRKSFFLFFWSGQGRLFEAVRWPGSTNTADGTSILPAALPIDDGGLCRGSMSDDHCRGSERTVVAAVFLCHLFAKDIAWFWYMTAKTHDQCRCHDWSPLVFIHVRTVETCGAFTGHPST